MKKPPIHIITSEEWNETANSPLGRPFYKTRFNRVEVEGIPGITPPLLITRRNYNTENIEFLYSHDLIY